MEDQQIDLLRVGQLALRAGPWRLLEDNLYAGGLKAMHASTGLSVETCQEVMEALAKQASQQAYESDLRSIRRAAEEVRRDR
jgi:hypothetical protein